MPELKLSVRLHQLLLPEKPRDFPYRRWVRMSCRALHIFGIGVLLGGHVFEQPVDLIMPWLLLAVASGFLLLATDLVASCAVLFEARGLAILAKLLLLLLVPILWDARVFILAIALVIGVFFSHMPGKYRHRVLIAPNWVTAGNRTE